MASSSASDNNLDDEYIHKSAEELNAADELKSFRSEFHLPTYAGVGAIVEDGVSLEDPCTYLCGNSLGALAKRSSELVRQELDVWGSKAVEGHFNHPHSRPWMPIASLAVPTLARLVGAKESEVACMSTLTTNLHLMLNSFYKPTKERYKILCEARAFPSDRYAFHSQASAHGFDPSTAVIELAPRPGEFTLRLSDILTTISTHSSSLALIVFPGIQYCTGQLFPIEAITRAGHEAGAIVGWDLAHGIGNVWPLKLHEWKVDWAVWCSYKYLNSGPGGIAGLFVHERWDEESPARLHGWWGHNEPTRFKMPHKFRQIPGAGGYQQSNPSALLVASLLGSLELFDRASSSSSTTTISLSPSSSAEETKNGMPALRRKSKLLTAWLEARLRESKYFVPVDKLVEVFPHMETFEFAHADPGAAPDAPKETTQAEAEKEKEVKDGWTKPDPRFTIITPSEPDSRGAQLSLFWPHGGRSIVPPSSSAPTSSSDPISSLELSSTHDTPETKHQTLMTSVFASLKRYGVIGDEREPDVIRLSPVPLYNTFADCEQAARVLERVLGEL